MLSDAGVPSMGQKYFFQTTGGGAGFINNH
jgi:hypothetical protein